ncbi:hypothetical protein GCM10023185_45680 [Hymenobacter saemangeumensis]|uniref:Uncharacterized protein n=1 Tax=Hymenobacter saemangeumensis TaxID=1084522 RepID=A0ABP8ISM5_9BACT
MQGLATGVQLLQLGAVVCQLGFVVGGQLAFQLLALLAHYWQHVLLVISPDFGIEGTVPGAGNSGGGSQQTQECQG